MGSFTPHGHVVTADDIATQRARSLEQTLLIQLFQ